MPNAPPKHEPSPVTKLQVTIYKSRAVTEALVTATAENIQPLVELLRDEMAEAEDLVDDIDRVLIRGDKL